MGGTGASAINTRGRVLFVGSSTANSSEFVGAFSPDNANLGDSSVIESQNTSGGAFSSAFVMNTLAQIAGDRPIRFVGTGVALSESGSNRVSFTLNPGNLNNGILSQAIVAGPAGAVDFVTYGSSPEGFAVVALPASAYVTDISQASTTSNVRLTATTNPMIKANVETISK